MRISEHAPGTVCWVDLGVPDVGAATRFYAGLFDWEPRVSPEPEANGYTIFHHDGAAVAGVGPLTSSAQPPMWTIYIASRHADVTARAIESNGGRALIPPVDVMKTGRMGVFADPAGAVFGVWEPIEFPGMQRIGEPGSLTWAEVVVRDSDGIDTFYRDVFGWTSRPMPDSQAPYQEFLLGGRSVAGLMQMTADWPADTPAHWMPYFEVADCDAVAAAARSMGGQVGVAPTDIPAGRFALLTDPFGAYFSIIKMSPDFPRG